MSAEQGAALLVPALSERQRAVMGEWLRENGAIQALGVNYPMQTDWAADDYSAWWWFFTPDHVAALLRVAGFEIRRSESYWQGRATLYMATPTGAAG